MNALNPFLGPLLAAGVNAPSGDPDRGFLIADIRPNAGGTAMVDYSPYGWTVTENGAGGWTYDVDKATADGTNYLTVDVDPALLSPDDISQMTVEVSCSAGTAATSQYFVYAGTTSSQVWSIAAYAGNAESYRNNGSGGTVTGAALSNGTRVDLKLLVNKTAGLLLSDNVPNSASSYAAATFGSGTIDKLYIGESPTAAPVLTSGSEIYRVRIYRGILKHNIAVPTAALPDPTGDSNVEIQLDFDGSITDASDNAYSFTGGAVDTNNPKFGSGNMRATATGGTGASTTLNSGYGTGDYGIEGWLSPADESFVYREMFRVCNTWLYRRGKIVEIWLDNSTFKASTSTPVFNANTYRHYYYAKKNGIGMLWVSGRLCLFYVDDINNTSTQFYISSPTEFYGDIDEVRLTNSGTAYLPTLMRDETAYDTASAESGFNWFASTIYTGTGSAKALNFTEFDVSTGALTVTKNLNEPASRYWVWEDTKRGVNKTLYSNTADAEDSVGGYLSSFDDDGYTVDFRAFTNASTYLHSAMALRADLSASVTVDSQSLTLRHSGKGFGMIYMDRTLGGASSTVSFDISSMGLIGEPMVILKRLDSTTDWNVSHPGLTNGYYLRLNSNDAETNAGSPETRFGNNSITVRPTATSLTIGNAAAFSGKIIIYILGEVSATASENYIKLLDFAHTSGQASYAECGWQPAFSVCKMRDVSSDWISRQTKRGTGLSVVLNSAAVEATDYGAHGPFGVELNGAYAVTGNVIGFAVRGN